MTEIFTLHEAKMTAALDRQFEATLQKSPRTGGWTCLSLAFGAITG